MASRSLDLWPCQYVQMKELIRSRIRKAVCWAAVAERRLYVVVSRRWSFRARSTYIERGIIEGPRFLSVLTTARSWRLRRFSSAANWVGMRLEGAEVILEKWVWTLSEKLATRFRNSILMLDNGGFQFDRIKSPPGSQGVLLSAKNILVFASNRNFSSWTSFTGVEDFGDKQKFRPSPSSDRHPGGRVVVLGHRLWNAKLLALPKNRSAGMLSNMLQRFCRRVLEGSTHIP